MNFSTTKNTRSPIEPYKTTVLTGMCIFILFLILLKFLKPNESELTKGLQLICGAEVKIKTKRKYEKSWPFFHIQEVVIKPSAGVGIDAIKVIDHLERYFYGYTFRRSHQHRGYDVFISAKKI